MSEIIQENKNTNAKKAIPNYSVGLSRADQLAKAIVNKYGVNVKVGESPCVDLKTNTIYVPPFDPNDDTDVSNMIHYIVHEVGHILYSDQTELRGIKFKILNVTEDQRINAKQELKYAGISFKVMEQRIMDKMARSNKKSQERVDDFVKKLEESGVDQLFGIDKEKIKENQEAIENLNIFISGLLMKCHGVAKAKIKKHFKRQDWWQAYESIEGLLEHKWVKIPSSALLEDDAEAIFDAIKDLLPENFENETTSDGSHVVSMPADGFGQGDPADQSDQGQQGGQGGDQPLSQQGGTHSENGFSNEDLENKVKNSSCRSDNVTEEESWSDGDKNNNPSYGTNLTDRVMENTTFYRYNPNSHAGSWSQRDRLDLRSKMFYNRFLDMLLVEDQIDHQDGYSSGKLAKPHKIMTSPRIFSKIQDGVTHEKVDVTIICDYSGSMGGYTQNVAEVGGGIALALSKLQIPHQMFGYDSSYGSDCKVYEIIPYSTIFDARMCDALFKMNSGGGTPTGEALMYCLEKHVLPKPGFRKLVFLITDGCPNNPSYTEDIVKIYRRYKDIKLSGIGVGSSCENLLRHIPDAMLMKDFEQFTVEGQQKFFNDLEKFMVGGRTII